ncbi:MAG: hypothetical protein ACK5M1_12755 [Xanthomarina gelatinilytica]|uniref:hypothetical protein n=1 Tax=Xanthomarina gelatinilytica TaxID=1137281 RepID=UPI003A871CBD
MYRSVFFILFFFSCINAFSHENINVTKDFGNVKVVFVTSYYYEEINKGLILGHYAERLSRKLGFKDQIVLYFKHNTGYKDYSLKYKKKDSSKFLYLEMEDSIYQVEDILKFIEYGIQNRKGVKKNGVKNFTVSDLKKSETVKQTLFEKVYRPKFVEELNLKGGADISYFYQENFFSIISGYKETERILFKVENIFQFTPRDVNSVLIFDTKESFYFLKNENFDSVFRPIRIKEIDDYHGPYKIYPLSKNKTSISCMPQRGNKDERVMIYLFDKKKLIQSLNELINKSNKDN